MYANSQYQMHHEIISSTGAIVRKGNDFTFNTGSIPAGIAFPAGTVVTSAKPPSSGTAPILPHDYLGFVPTATDLSCNVLWYYNERVGQLMRTETGGKMLMNNSHNPNLYYNTLLEIDLGRAQRRRQVSETLRFKATLATGPKKFLHAELFTVGY